MTKLHDYNLMKFTVQLPSVYFESVLETTISLLDNKTYYGLHLLKNYEFNILVFVALYLRRILRIEGRKTFDKGRFKNMANPMIASRDIRASLDNYAIEIISPHISEFRTVFSYYFSLSFDV